MTTGMGSATPRPLTADEERKFRESVATIDRIKGDDDYSLQWSNYAAARLLATLDRLRAIEAAARAVMSLIEEDEFFQPEATALRAALDPATTEPKEPE